MKKKETKRDGEKLFDMLFRASYDQYREKFFFGLLIAK